MCVCYFFSGSKLKQDFIEWIFVQKIVSYLCIRALAAVFQHVSNYFASELFSY